MRMKKIGVGSAYVHYIQTFVIKIKIHRLTDIGNKQTCSCRQTKLTLGLACLAGGLLDGLLN